MSQLEILAPAGSKDMLTAAVRSGTDAVYLGLGNFNARRSAPGFSDEELAWAVRYCHERGVRVHGAVNTTVYPDELNALSETIANAANAGVDALIVQDLAAAEFARKIAPELELHGSTQMSVHTLQGALQLADMGFDRVILARELCLNEIRSIVKECPIETEIFVHGALCMCVSGQCYMSAFLGGRSGNRGNCAGTCRLPFRADMFPVDKPAQAFHLSLKDMDIIDYMQDFQELGISSVKIEGRLRTPEYVAAAVAACRAAREGKAYDRNLLADVFSRSGFTGGYLKEKRDRTMFGVRTEQDAARTREALPKARELFRREFQRIAVNMDIYCDEDGACLTVSDDEKRVYSVCNEKPQPAHTDPIEGMKHSLKKTGGTPFYVKNINIEMGGGSWFFSSSTINDLRRDCLEKLLQVRGELPKRKIERIVVKVDQRSVPQHKIAARFENISQIPWQIVSEMHRIILPIAEADRVPAQWRSKTILELPRVMFGVLENQTIHRVYELKDQGFAGFEANNIAHLRMCSEFPIVGGFGLNIANPVAAMKYRSMGLAGMTILPEATLNQISKIDPGIPTAVIIYGYMPLMVTRACPMQNITDCSRCSQKGALTDRKSTHFQIRCGQGTRKIYNSVPIYMGDKQEQIPSDVIIAYFTIETRDRAEKVISLLLKGEAFDGEFTRGLYYKGTC